VAGLYRVMSLSSKWSGLILSIGGTLAALVQTLGYSKVAGAIMVVANLSVISLSILDRLKK